MSYLLLIQRPVFPASILFPDFQFERFSWLSVYFCSDLPCFKKLLRCQSSCHFYYREETIFHIHFRVFHKKNIQRCSHPYLTHCVTVHEGTWFLSTCFWFVPQIHFINTVSQEVHIKPNHRNTSHNCSISLKVLQTSVSSLNSSVQGNSMLLVPFCY